MAVKRILVIDDEENLCAVIQACLENLGGWTVEIATSSHVGLLKAQTLQPDTILLDVMMPEMDGLTLFKQLQDHSLTQTIPVILLTAKVQTTDLEAFTKLGFAGMIAKPFDPLILCDQVAAILGW